MRRRMTPQERQDRAQARAAAKAEQEVTREERRAWLSRRANQAKVAAQYARKLRLSEPRGVDRVPERLRVTHELPGLVVESKHGTPIVSELGTYLGRSANYRTRRAMGQRGHRRRPRRRELQGAVNRRLIRRQKEWQS